MICTFYRRGFVQTTVAAFARIDAKPVTPTHHAGIVKGVLTIMGPLWKLHGRAGNQAASHGSC